VARNAAQGGEDVAGHHDGGLFNEDPQSIHVMNEILNIFTGLTDINDVAQNVSTFSERTPQQVSCSHHAKLL
jgi:hypothetical protein